MKPIPIGDSHARKQAAEAEANDGSSTDTNFELVLTEEAMQELRDAEARELAQARARLAGAGMVGTLLDIKV